MANRLMDRLGLEYRALVEQYEGILNRCAEEGRDPDDTEAGLLDGLRSEMGPLGDRLIELRETDDRRMAAVRAMSDAPVLPEASRLPVVHVRSEEMVYQPPDAGAGRACFFRDMLHAQVDRDPDAMARIWTPWRSMRAMASGSRSTWAWSMSRKKQARPAPASGGW